MRDSLRDELKTALRARDRVAITALRSALAAIDNAEAIPVEHGADAVGGSEHVAGAALGVGAAEAERRHLTETDQRAIIDDEVRERSAAAREYRRLGRDDLADQLSAEAEVLNRQLRA